jgi:Protein of unknown function (DUF559)
LYTPAHADDPAPSLALSGEPPESCARAATCPHARRAQALAALARWAARRLPLPPPVPRRSLRRRLLPAARLVIEVDGDSHAENVEYDTERTRWLSEQKHYRVIRFTNEDVRQRMEAVLDAIVAAAKKPPP